MLAEYDRAAPRKAVNVSCNSDLLRQARELSINLSAVLEAALVEETRKRRAERWLAENRPAMDAYNKMVEEQGVFSDGLRSF